MSLSFLFFHFLFLFSFGSFLFLPLVDSRLTGAAHSKIITLISACLSLMASLGLGLAKFNITPMVVLTLIYSLICFVVWSFHKDQRSKIIYFLYAVANGLVLYYLYLLPYSALDKWYFFLCATCLGVINYTMILGHYYLVVPKLTVMPLIYGLRFYWLFLTLKILSIYPFNSLVYYWKNTFLIFFASETMVSNIDLADLSLFILQQLSAFIALPLLSYYAYKLCRMRSTQSATGVLYVMVFFALISEFISLYFLLLKSVRI